MRLPKTNADKTEWDILRDVPFAGDKESIYQKKNYLRGAFIRLKNNNKYARPSAKGLMLSILNEIQPLMATEDMSGVLDNYQYWFDLLCELRPFMASLWSEFDPMIVHYLFTVFVSRFLTLLQMWAKMDYAIYCTKDCASIGEFFICMGLIEGHKLSDVAARWNLIGEGRREPEKEN